VLIKRLLRNNGNGCVRDRFLRMVKLQVLLNNNGCLNVILVIVGLICFINGAQGRQSWGLWVATLEFGQRDRVGVTRQVSCGVVDGS